MTHKSTSGKCLHPLPAGETAICPIHQRHDHDELDVLVEAVRSEAYSEGYSDGISYADASRMTDE